LSPSPTRIGGQAAQAAGTELVAASSTASGAAPLRLKPSCASSAATRSRATVGGSAVVALVAIGAELVHAASAHATATVSTGSDFRIGIILDGLRRILGIGPTGRGSRARAGA
jgi:hypothetical protein